jgi:hypothetical protein
MNALQLSHENSPTAVGYPADWSSLFGLELAISPTDKQSDTDILENHRINQSIARRSSFIGGYLLHRKSACVRDSQDAPRYKA